MMKNIRLPSKTLKLMTGLSMLVGFSAAAAPQAKLVCVSGTSIDQISKVEVVPTDLTGQINATTTSATKEKSFNSNGSIDSDQIQLSYEDKGPYGKIHVFLEKTAAGYAIVKYNQCSFLYQEETCSPDEPLEEIARENNVSCAVI